MDSEVLATKKPTLLAIDPARSGLVGYAYWIFNRADIASIMSYGSVPYDYLQGKLGHLRKHKAVRVVYEYCIFGSKATVECCAQCVGEVRGVVGALPWDKRDGVTPRVWQRYFGVDSKSESCRVAAHNIHRHRPIKDHHAADAINIGYFFIGRDYR